jgi:predicted nucleic acid-binding protein
MADYLLDTNHASWFMADEFPLLKLAQQSRSSSSRFGISVTVLVELYYAVYASHYRDQNLKRLQRLLDSFLLWPLSTFPSKIGWNLSNPKRQCPQHIFRAFVNPTYLYCPL